MNKREEAAQAKRDAATAKFQADQLEILRKGVNREEPKIMTQEEWEEAGAPGYKPDGPSPEDGVPDPTKVNTETTGDEYPKTFIYWNSSRNFWAYNFK